MTIIVYSESNADVLSVFEDEDEFEARLYLKRSREHSEDTVMETLPESIEQAQEVLMRIAV